MSVLLIERAGLGQVYGNHKTPGEPLDVHGPRVRFAWGYIDGAQAAREDRSRLEATGYDNIHIAGADAGYTDVLARRWDAGRGSVNRAWRDFLCSLDADSLRAVWIAEFAARYTNQGVTLRTPELCRAAVEGADVATLHLLAGGPQ